MPGYYQQRPMAAQLPPTPPDSGSAYAFSSAPYAQGSYLAHASMGQARHEPGYEYQQGYLPPAVTTVAPSSYQYQPSTYQSAANLPPIQTSYYEPIGAPLLPPIRTYDRTALADDYQRQLQAEQQSAVTREQQMQPTKEEKATGGVSAKLDYDMERMTDFVADAAQSIFQQSTAHPSFRKWVNQVLAATRLPSATILLSLHYLHDRLMKFPHSVRRDDENQVYRLLAVSLILGSKFLDDNTFINRSWSDVTSIKVAELNLLEMKWLHLIKYQLHVDLKENEGLLLWIATWRKYDADYLSKQQQPTRLSPLDTNVYQHANTREARYSPYPTPYSASSRTADSSVSSMSARSSHFSTPYSANEPWVTSNERQSLDDYYGKRPHRYPDYAELEAVSRRAEERPLHPSYAYPQSAHPSYYHTATYSPWDQQAWNGVHHIDCNCSTCAYQQHYRPYANYAAQTVMG